MYDAIVVGARCAGSATALLLARQGHKVLLVDRAAFPSDTISGHFIFHRGVVRLKRWGLLDPLIASNCPPVTWIASDLGDFTLSGEVPIIEDAPAAIGPRRTVLDNLLLNAAADAGVEVRQNFTVSDVLRDGDQVVGIRGHSQKDASSTERARIVIGADGKHSRIAQLVHAPTYKEMPPLTCWYYTYWSGLPSRGLELYWRHHQLILVFPTHDGLTFAVVGMPHGEFDRFRSDIEGTYLNAIGTIPELAERIRTARREERFYGMADLAGFFRKPYGAGWALVGDAGHHKDPTPAHGISDAFCDAELLAEAVHASLGGTQSWQDALSHYEQARNARAMPDYEQTCQLAQLEQWDAPEMRGLRAALRGNAEETGQYLGVLAKAVPGQAFYAPDNLQRILRQANQVPQTP